MNIYECTVPMLLNVEMHTLSNSNIRYVLYSSYSSAIPAKMRVGSMSMHQNVLFCIDSDIISHTATVIDGDNFVYCLYLAPIVFQCIFN